MTRFRALGVLALVLLALACSDSLAPASGVTGFRVVAARVSVASDAERANPLPDEAVEVSLLTIDRGSTPPDDSSLPTLTPGFLQWSLIPCVPLPVSFGAPICLTPIEPCEGCLATPPTDALATPVVRFTLPPEATFEEVDATSVLLQGAVCSNGTPSPEAILRFLAGESDDLSPCVGPPTIPGVPIEGRFVAAAIPLERDPDDPNLNPELLNVLLDGMSWPPPYDRGVPRNAPRTGCADDLSALSEDVRDAHPRAGDEPSVIDLSVTEASLQTFTVEDQELVEEMQVSWLADDGTFERSFSFITDPATSVLTQWRPQAEAPEDGELVRFHFVIRDGRGGTDAFERGLCILPPAPDDSPP